VKTLRQIEIGVDKNGYAANSTETKKQINEIKTLKCALCNSKDKETPYTWDDFDDPAEDRSLFQSIVNDRKIRIDQRVALCCRPPYSICTIFKDEVIRLEFYEGEDELSRVHDIRRSDLYGLNEEQLIRKLKLENIDNL
jgi:hypothetical protein